MAHSVTSGGMDAVNGAIGTMAKGAVTKIDPNMANMPKLIESTRVALAAHFKDQVVKEINCPGSNEPCPSPM